MNIVKSIICQKLAKKQRLKLRKEAFMTVEEELLIEMIKGKLTTSRLQNLKILSECLDKYEKKSGLVDYLKSKIHENIPDDNYETKDEFLSEVENVIKHAEKLASDGETSKALKELLVLTYLPSFYVDMGHSSFDCRNEYEFFCTCMKYNHCYQTDVNFSYISSRRLSRSSAAKSRRLFKTAAAFSYISLSYFIYNSSFLAERTFFQRIVIKIRL